jgi:hypothetical protein
MSNIIKKNWDFTEGQEGWVYILNPSGSSEVLADYYEEYYYFAGAVVVNANTTIQEAVISFEWSGSFEDLGVEEGFKIKKIRLSKLTYVTEYYNLDPNISFEVKHNFEVNIDNNDKVLLDEVFLDENVSETVNGSFKDLSNVESNDNLTLRYNTIYHINGSTTSMDYFAVGFFEIEIELEISNEEIYTTIFYGNKLVAFGNKLIKLKK